MEILKVIQGRRSIRAYRSDLVNIDKLRDLVLEAAIWAPFAGNAQILRYIVVTDHSMLHKIELVSPGLSGNPPALIVVCQDSDEAQLKGGSMGPQFLAIADAAMAIQNIMLYAYTLGLETCVIASFHRGALQTILSLSRSIVPIFIVSVGYPDCSPKKFQQEKRRSFGLMSTNNKDKWLKQICEQLLELICYTIISARNLVEEPKLYGPLRMIDIPGRLLDILSCKDIEFPLLPVFHKHIETTKNSLIEGEASFVANLDSLVADAISVLTNSQKEDNQ